MGTRELFGLFSTPEEPISSGPGNDCSFGLRDQGTAALLVFGTFVRRCFLHSFLFLPRQGPVAACGWMVGPVFFFFVLYFIVGERVPRGQGKKWRSDILVSTLFMNQNPIPRAARSLSLLFRSNSWMIVLQLRRLGPK